MKQDSSEPRKQYNEQYNIYNNNSSRIPQFHYNVNSDTFSTLQNIS